MKEFKTLSFVIFDEKGKPHKIKFDKIEGEYPTVQIFGNNDLILRRLKAIYPMIEKVLKEQK